MKRYIEAFAYSRKKAIDTLYNMSSTFNEHIIKCIIFGKYRPESLKHWEEERVICLYTSDGTNIKASKLKSKDYINTIFSEFGDSKEDAKGNLAFFIKDNVDRYQKKDFSSAFPYFRINDEMTNCLYGCYNKILKQCLPMLLEKNTHDIEEWDGVISSIVMSCTYDFKNSDVVTKLYDCFR